MRYNRYHHALTRLLLGCAVVLLFYGSACSTTSLHGKPFIEQATFDNSPPHSLALLPTTDVSGHPKMAVAVRQALFGSVARLSYMDTDLKLVDDFIAKIAAQQGIPPEKIPPETLADPKLADCVAYTQLQRISRLYLILYAHNRFDLDFVMVDTRTRHIIYRNHFVFYDRISSPVFSIYDFIGMFMSSVQSLWYLRDDQVVETLEKGAKEIAKALPAPKFEYPESKNLKLTEVKVTTPGNVLGPGMRVVVEAKGTPKRIVTFSLGRIAHDIPMEENSAGHYMGIYTVKAGDNTAYAAASLRMKVDTGDEKIEYTVKERTFAIDTQPPPRACVSKCGQHLFRAGVFLTLALNEDDVKKNDESVEYYIYRKVTGNARARFEEVGVTRNRTFHDATADADQAYDYYVVTRDQAGNFSEPWKVVSYKEG